MNKTFLLALITLFCLDLFGNPIVELIFVEETVLDQGDYDVTEFTFEFELTAPDQDYYFKNDSIVIWNTNPDKTLFSEFNTNESSTSNILLLQGGFVVERGNTETLQWSFMGVTRVDAVYQMKTSSIRWYPDHNLTKGTSGEVGGEDFISGPAESNFVFARGQAVPEPKTFFLLAIGMILIAKMARKTHSRK